MEARIIRKSLINWMLHLVLLLTVVGCASSAKDPRNIAKRIKERSALFQTLSAEDQALINQGQIKVGMTPDEVYLAWGSAAQELKSEDITGRTDVWLYQDTASDEYVYWNYREVRRQDGTSFFDRYPETTYNFHDYVSAELTFRGGKLASWRTLAKPANNTIIAPLPVR